MLDLAIVNGTIVTPAGVKPGSVGVQNGKIAVVAAPDVQLEAARVIDAGGKHILPGVIDPHVHLRNNPWSDSCERETRSLISGGVTTALVFVEAPNGSYFPVVEERSAMVGKSSYCDVGFHPIIMSLDHVREVPELADKWGCTSYKMYFAADSRQVYPGTITVNDGILWEAFKQIAALGS